MSVFSDLVLLELRRARWQHLPIKSAHEGFAVLLEEVDEFKAEVWKNRHDRSESAMLAELVQIGAMAQRVAEDLRITPDLRLADALEMAHVEG